MTCRVFDIVLMKIRLLGTCCLKLCVYLSRASLFLVLDVKSVHFLL